MAWYALQRLGLSLLICVLALTVLFCTVHVIPGDPATIALGPRATAAMKEAFHAAMGLDRPLPVQVGLFFLRVLKGDLGTDVLTGRSVSAVVLEALPYTLALALASLGWAVALGIPLGCFSALHRNTLLDRLAALVSVAAISMPSFVIAIYGLLVFAVRLNWLPAIGAGEAGNLPDQLRHLVLPAFAVGLGWVGYLARIVRASMLEVLGENHVRTARAFGLAERTVVYRYALRIAILPTVTLIGIGLGGLLSSAVFAEVVFSRPGLGTLVYGAALGRNFPVVMGAVLTTVFLFALFNLAADLLVAVLDPRVRGGL